MLLTKLSNITKAEFLPMLKSAELDLTTQLLLSAGVSRVALNTGLLETLGALPGEKKATSAWQLLTELAYVESKWNPSTPTSDVFVSFIHLR